MSSYSYTLYSGNGALTTFSYSGIALIDSGSASVASQLKVYVAGVDTAFTVVSTDIVLGAPAPDGDEVKIIRATKADDRYVDWTQQAQLDADAMNLDGDQTFFMAQEAKELAELTVALEATGNLDMNGKRIVNMAAAVDSLDAITLAELNARLVGGAVSEFTAQNSVNAIATGLDITLTAPGLAGRSDDDVNVYVEGRHLNTDEYSVVDFGLDLQVNILAAATLNQDYINVVWSTGITTGAVDPTLVDWASTPNDVIPYAAIDVEPADDAQWLTVVSGLASFEDITHTAITDWTATLAALDLNAFLPPSANLPMGSFRVTGLADALNAGDAPNWAQVQAYVNASGGTVSSVNGEIGDVVLATSHLADFATASAVIAAATVNTSLISELSDVPVKVIDGVSPDRILRADSLGVLTWEVEDGGALIINDLTDVDTVTVAPTNGDVLTWNTANSEWEPQVSAGAGALVIDDITDVDTTTAAPTTGQSLTWDGTNWVPDTLLSTDLTDFTSASGVVAAVQISNTAIDGLSGVAQPPVVSGPHVLVAGEVLDYAWTDYTPLPTAGTAGQVLSKIDGDDYNVEWSAGGGGGGASVIDDLTDVDTTTTAPTDGQVLTWNNANSEWEPQAAGAGVTDFTDLSDVTITAAATGEVIRYNGSAWVDAALAEADISDLGAYETTVDSDAYTDTATERILASGASTGVDAGGTLSKGTVGTINISAGSGHVVDTTTDPDNPTITDVTWGASTNLTLTLLATNHETHIAIDSAGSVVQRFAAPTGAHERDEIQLGIINHPDNTTVEVAHNAQHVGGNPGAQLYELMDAIGGLNLSGNVIGPSGADLTIDKSAGTAFEAGTNFATDPTNPHVTTDAALTDAVFEYVLQDGTVHDAAATVIDPAIYDVSGVATAVPAHKWTMQHIFMTTEDAIVIQPGQGLYGSQSQAEAAISSVHENFVLEDYLKEAGLLRGWLITRGDSTDLSDPNHATFYEAGKFGGTPDVSRNTLQDILSSGTSTGMSDGGVLSVGSPTSTFSISDGHGHVIDTTTAPYDSTLTQVEWSGLTNLTVTNLATHHETYVSIDATGAVVQRTTLPTNDHHRDELILGVLFHEDNATVRHANNHTAIGMQPAAQLNDLMQAIGDMNLSGNVFGPNGANLNIDKTIGTVFSSGANWGTSQIGRASCRERV